MADISYPTSLPVPQASTVTPAERRALSDAQRPRDARAMERDQRELQRVTWPAMNATQISTFDAWWRTTLVFGGAWFSSRWPLPRGFVAAVRKISEQPKWEYLGNGYWRGSALCEVRGETVLVVNDNPWGNGGGGGDGGVIAWLDPIGSSSGTATAGNEGTRDDYLDPDFHILYAGVVGYTSGTVSWSVASWTPFFFFGDSPVLTPLAGGKVKVEFARDSSGGGSSDQFGAGILRLTATVDGVAAEDDLSAQMNTDFYTPLSWRTAEPLLSLGWHTNIYDVDDAAVHGNVITENYNTSFQFVYLSVLDYDIVLTPTVVFSTTWTPFVADPSPDFGTASYGQTGVATLNEIAANTTSRGTLAITATVGGLPTDSVRLVIGPGPNNSFTAEPVP